MPEHVIERMDEVWTPEEIERFHRRVEAMVLAEFADDRTKITLQAKDYWMERAIKAETRVKELEAVLDRCRLAYESQLAGEEVVRLAHGSTMEQISERVEQALGDFKPSEPLVWTDAELETFLRKIPIMTDAQLQALLQRKQDAPPTVSE